MDHEIKVIDGLNCSTPNIVIELDGVTLNLPWTWEEFADMKRRQNNE